MRRRSPQICNKHNVEQIYKVQPSIKHKPPSLPVLRNKVIKVPAGKDEGVDEEETKDHDDASQNTPPKLLVHHRFDALLSVDQIFHRCAEGIQCPDIESSQRRSKGEDNEQNQWSSTIGGNRETCDSVDDAKYEMRDG